MTACTEEPCPRSLPSAGVPGGWETWLSRFCTFWFCSLFLLLVFASLVCPLTPSLFFLGVFPLVEALPGVCSQSCLRGAQRLQKSALSSFLCCRNCQFSSVSTGRMQDLSLLLAGQGFKFSLKCRFFIFSSLPTSGCTHSRCLWHPLKSIIKTRTSEIQQTSARAGKH